MAQAKRTRIVGFPAALVRIAVLAALVVGAGRLTALESASAQSGGGSEGAASGVRVESLVEDFAHYVYIANNDLAKANAEAILDLSMDARDFLALVEDDPRLEERFRESYREAMKRAALADVASELRDLYEQGRRARARDVDEIKRNIELLTEGARARRLGHQRLLEAGEYGVPELLRVLIERRDAARVLEVKRVLRDLNKHAVAPLTTALLEVRPTAQAEIARILGGIGYESALPFLVELRETTADDAVRATARRAIERIGSAASGLPVHALYRELAEDYYDHSPSLTPFPGERFQPLWVYSASVGLYPRAIRTAVYHEALAMRHASRAMRLDRSDDASLAIWVASNYSREADEPEGYENPVYPSGEREASYYAVASGNRVLQMVLARAIDDRDTRLARQSIEALGVSAGEDAIRGSSGADRSLVRALDYPDRQVRYDAALVLASVRPESYFEGAERVVPILAGAIRDGSTRYAGVISHEEERQQFLRNTLEGAGFTVLPPGRSVGELMSSVATVPGVDVILMDTTENRTEEAIREIRRTARLSATPVVSILPVSAANRMRRGFYGEALVRFSREGVSGSEIMRKVEDLVEETTGEALSPSDARAYATEAVSALRDIAVASGGVYAIEDATLQLIGALESREGEIVSGIAGVLARIGESRAQSAIMDRALGASGARRIEMLRRVTESARRFGNMLEPRHERWLSGRLRDASGEEATAVAGLVGALGIADDAVVDLILDR